MKKFRGLKDALIELYRSIVVGKMAGMMIQRRNKKK
jgi:hypothetical protein